MQNAAPGSQQVLAPLVAFFAAHQPDSYLVGGFLRDGLLSRPSHDVDVAVSGDPQSLGVALARAVGGSFVPLSPAHGVARIVVNEPGGPSWTVDLARYLGTIEDDLERRDFTINAMALPLEYWTAPDWRQHLIDPLGGQQAIARKHIQAVTANVFQEDPGRLLRAVRQAANLNFRIEPATIQLIRADASGIERVSPERVRDEFLAILAGNGARGQLEVLDYLDLLCRFIPELAITRGVEQPRAHHYWDVWNHLLHAVEFAELVTGGHQHSAIYSNVPWTPEIETRFNQQVSDHYTRRTILKLAALFHDIAKPQTRKPDETGRIRFLGHPDLGAEMTENRLSELRLSTRGVAMVSKMVQQHLRPTHMSHGGELPSHRAIYRYYRELEDIAIDTLYLCMADFLAAKGPEVTAVAWANHARMMTHILQSGMPAQPAEKPERLLTGYDLINHFNLQPGPRIGQLLNEINEASAAGEVVTQEEALTLAAQLLTGGLTHSQEQG